MDAVRLLAVVGLRLDPWQSDVLCDWMARDAAGRWAAPSCGGSVPRQNGKTLLIQSRALPGMILFNEKVIYTSHLQKTSTETFCETRDLFEHPALKPYVKDIKNALGREEILLKSGARIKFLARTRNGGRGQHGDLLIFDEAQELDETAQGSFLPAISASLNPQTIYVGTPPGPDVPGTVFREFRRRALAGEARRAAWFEFSVPEIGDIHEIYDHPAHPYTQGLLQAVPVADPDYEKARAGKRVMLGEVASPINPGPGCRFCSRCPRATERCRSETPALREVESGHFAACHNL